MPLAEYNLAGGYAQGHGVPQSDQEAAKWCLRAAEHGDASARIQDGFDVRIRARRLSQDRQKAVRWLLEASKRGIKAADERLKRIGRKLITAVEIVAALFKQLMESSPALGARVGGGSEWGVRWACRTQHYKEAQNGNEEGRCDGRCASVGLAVLSGMSRRAAERSLDYDGRGI